MEKIDVAIDSDDEVVKMIMSIFLGKDGANNIVTIIQSKTDPKSKIYDKAFDKALRKLKPEWF